ncbi:hypothetical protein K440DRAFT_55354 [Wilcoxina mikolae CBS 423.85]|nr:hypothetical protein K440DRAFT_55354 [Wilcoxina mikolae CBS 423.85]
MSSTSIDSRHQSAHNRKRRKIATTPEQSPPPSDNAALPKNANADPSKPRSFRISLIPNSVDEVQLRQDLRRLSVDSDDQNETLGATRNIVALCLIPRGTWKVATVSFRKEPLDFAACSPQHTIKLRLSGLDPHTIELPTVDVDFNGITPLYSPLTQSPTVDIVAVTGLSGHAFGSWRSSSGDIMWLRDSLPRDFPHIRVLTFGYDSELGEPTSTSSLADYSR